jgi:NTP pyrophosphatase (non-canonical NTP hydrolase)
MPSGPDVVMVLADRAGKAMAKRGWNLSWEGRGAYLALECAELIEAIRGKGDSSAEEEFADVLLVLLSILWKFKLNFRSVVGHVSRKLSGIEDGTIGAKRGD